MESSVFLVVCAGLALMMGRGVFPQWKPALPAKNASNTIFKCITGFVITVPSFLALGNQLAGMRHDGLTAVILAALWAARRWCASFGALMERITFAAFCAVSLLMALVVYPLAILARNVFLVGLGYHDFTGLASLATACGMAALVGAKKLGPRIGKYSGGGVSRAMPGHNIPLSLLGMLTLVVACLRLLVRRLAPRF